MKAHVIVDANGRVDRRNDEDQRFSIFVSRAHAKRVIQWLGLTERVIREATEDEIACGILCAVHCAASEATPESMYDFADQIGVATLR